MSIKLPYILLCQQVDKYTTKMARAISIEDFNKSRDIYFALLESTGWDEKSFDEETLNQIDRGWGND